MSQDWDELEALRESLREHMAEIKRLNDCLTWEQHRAEHVGTHGPGCAEWGPRHYECLLRAHKALKERTNREDWTVEPVTDCHKKEGGKLTPPLPQPVAYISDYHKGRCIIEPVDRNVLLPVGMALYRSPPKREPLHDMKVFDLADGHLYDGGKNYGVLAFARAIERAHGIGGEE